MKRCGLGFFSPVSINPDCGDKQSNRNKLAAVSQKAVTGADTWVCCEWCSRCVLTKHQGREGRAQVIMAPVLCCSHCPYRGDWDNSKSTVTWEMASLLPTARVYTGPTWLLWCQESQHAAASHSLTPQLACTQARCSHLSGWPSKHLLLCLWRALDDCPWHRVKSVTLHSALMPARAVLRMIEFNH